MVKTKIFGYKGGTFPKKELAEARKRESPLTLDFAIPCSCLNDCVFCGYKNTQKGKALSLDEIKRVISEFSEIGGKSIKILGEGEPLLRSDIFGIYKHIVDSGLQPVLFTCGDVMGDDNLTKKILGLSGEELVKELSKLETTVMLKYDAKSQDDISRKKGYSEKRNLALERLIKQGFNRYQPTHLGLGIVVLRLNYQEIPENYEWAIKNNIYPLLCPLMPIGKMRDLVYRRELSITHDEMVDLSARLYKIAFENDIKLESSQFPADFPGGLPCDISRAGFFIGSTGDIYLCESEERVGNIREIPLKDAWKKIKQIKDEKYGNDRWCGFCYEKRRVGVLPKDFEKKVLGVIKK